MLFFILERPWSTLLLSFMIHKYVSYHYPIQYENFCILCGYYAIYFFSKAQMVYLKLKPHVNKMIEPCLKNELAQKMLQLFKQPKTNYDLEFISNEEVVFRCLKEELLNESSFLPKNFDFIIYSEPSLETINKKLLYSIPKNIEEDLKIEISNFTFMLFELTIGKEPIKLHFSTNQYNFYVENNKINKEFLLYFLHNYHPEIFAKHSLEDIQKYKITYLDGSFSIKEVENNVEFLLKKTGFELIESSNTLDNTKISDFKNKNDNEDDNLPDLIQVNEESEEEDDLPDLIPIDNEDEPDCDDENEDLPDLIQVNEESEEEDLPNLIPMDDHEN